MRCALRINELTRHFQIEYFIRFIIVILILYVFNEVHFRMYLKLLINVKIMTIEICLCNIIQYTCDSWKGMR